MESFLKTVAHDLLQTCEGDLSAVAVVFPNKRASLFFSQYLAEECEGRPLWSPAYLSISDLFASLSPLQVGDPLLMIFELYKVFCGATESEETIDEFYFWGELLLSDFDDLDKNLVDVDQLFANLNDLKTVSADHSYITPEQEQAIQRFFSNFSVDNLTLVKRRFLSVWEKMGEIYHRLGERLTALGVAYEGMMYRDALSRLDVDSLPYRRYVFVGFNFLTQVERRLLRALKQAGLATFYWDYDVAYVNAHDMETPPEAARFIIDNLSDFPNALPPQYFDNLSHEKQVTYVAASTENAQARYFSQWAEEQMKAYNEEKPSRDAEDKSEPMPANEAAVVLCSEDLLLPLLRSTPPQVTDINITMGFPLIHTPAYTYLSALLALQIDGYRKRSKTFAYMQVQTVLRHPYVRRLSPQAADLALSLTQDARFNPTLEELGLDEFLAKLFTPQPESRALCAYLVDMLNEAAAVHRSDDGQERRVGQSEPLYREALFVAYTRMNSLLHLLTTQEADLQPATLQRLALRVLGSAKIPFHGEPAVGLQVIGALETRCLDFRRLLVLSLNEGQLPKTSSQSSFIPYPLRKAFGMTTLDHRDAVYAYTFFRLLQRAEHITLCYNSSSDNRGRGEMSRYMLQYLVHSSQQIRWLSLTPPQSSVVRQAITVEKTKEMMQAFREHYRAQQDETPLISPSALNTYLDCRLKYYFHYVARIKVDEEVTEGIEPAMFGTLFHLSAKKAYEHLSRHGALTVTAETIDELLGDEPRLRGFVDEAFVEAYFKPKEGQKPEYNGVQLIASRVIYSYLRRMLKSDAEHLVPFTVEGLEEEHSEYFPVAVDGERFDVRIGGIIDRMDYHDGFLRILDYKTGSPETSCESIEKLFTRYNSRPGHVFQALLYATIVRSQRPGVPLSPALLYIRKVSTEDFDVSISMGPRGKKSPIVDYTDGMADEFRKHLSNLLQEIFGVDTPFSQTDNNKVCDSCDYRELCFRGGR